MNLFLVLTVSALLIACGSKSNTPSGNVDKTIPFKAIEFPNQPNEIYGIWLGRVGESASSKSFRQKLAFSREGKFGVAMECDDNVGKIWASAVVKATIDASSYGFIERIEARVSDEKGNGCGFEMMPHTVYYSLDGTGNQLSIHATDGSGRQLYDRVN